MKESNVFTIPFRRKREGRTYYRQRIKILLSDMARFVIRGSSKNFQASIVQYDQKGDKILFTIDAKALSKMGWKGGTGNIPSAYLIGALAGKKALESGIKDAVLDIGFKNSTKGSRLYAALAGAIDSGLEIPFNKEVLPSTERISGKHIADYANMLKSDKTKYERQFSGYLKNGFIPEDLAKHFKEIKVRIHG